MSVSIQVRVDVASFLSVEDVVECTRPTDRVSLEIVAFRVRFLDELELQFLVTSLHFLTSRYLRSEHSRPSRPWIHRLQWYRPSFSLQRDQAGQMTDHIYMQPEDQERAQHPKLEKHLALVCHVTHFNFANGIESKICGELLIDGNEFVKSSVKGLMARLIVRTGVDDSEESLQDLQCGKRTRRKDLYCFRDNLRSACVFDSSLECLGRSHVESARLTFNQLFPHHSSDFTFDS
ncbi:hypothetical protein KCU83_g576, partial [Aureobasidium melanogenum]